MLRSAKDLQGFGIAATDGDIGSVQTFYFEDDTWTVRYLVVDTGGWLSGRLVLISPLAISRVDTEDHKVHVSLTKDKVQRSPGVDLDKPVSRQYEVAYYRYYGWPYYWGGAGLWGGWAYPAALGAETPPAPGQVEEQGDPHLRSMKEVMGYHIQATDDDIGHVEDFIMDDETWQIRYLAVDTSNWWFGKKVLLAPQWIRSVSWLDQNIYVDVTKDTIKNAPEWDGRLPIDRAYEQRLYDYYREPVYWPA